MDFFDFQGNGLNIEDLFWYATFIITILIPALAIVYRKGIRTWWDKRKARKREEYLERIRESVLPLIQEAGVTLKKEITEATQQIQPNANGGKSLTDLHGKVDVVLGQQSLMLRSLEQNSKDIATAKERIDDHLSYHIDNPPKS